MQVFTTVGSAAKRKFLLETFPGLRDDHIGDSRSESFEGLVRNMTRGKGVHLCLNSLSDEKLQVLVFPDLLCLFCITSKGSGWGPSSGLTPVES